MEFVKSLKAKVGKKLGLLRRFDLLRPFDRLRATWRCQTCGTTYRRNRRTCGDCDGTVFDRVR